MTDIIAALEDYYQENISSKKSMDYTFGFFDAVAVIRDLAGKGACR